MKTRSKQKKTKEKGKQTNILANVFLFVGLLLLALIFISPLLQEIEYKFNSVSGKKFQAAEVKEPGPMEKNTKTKTIVPESYEFGIVIPKINANAKIFANINPFEEKEFLPILKKGVAHARGTAFPGQGNNIYLFAHSTDAFYNAGRYNAVFYLLGKLKQNDEVDVYYQNKLYKYSVFEVKVVPSQAVRYLQPESEEILTLQTCYPPGTTLKRLIVRAKRTGN